MCCAMIRARPIRISRSVFMACASPTGMCAFVSTPMRLKSSPWTNGSPEGSITPPRSPPRRLLRQLHTRFVREQLLQPLRIPDNFPDMAVRVLKIAGIAAPESVVRRLDDGSTRGGGGRHHSIHLRPGRNIVPERHFRRAVRAERKAGIVRDAAARPQRKPQAGLELNEHHGAMFEFAADDALGGETEAIAVKAQRSVEIVDADGDDGNARLHDDAS